jgi:perosamine synthetase
MTRDGSIPLSRPHFPTAVRQAIATDIDAILVSGRMMNGPWAKRFEGDFRALTGRGQAVSVNTCTTALQIALTFADVRDKEVLVPAGSFITDISAVKYAGGRPVLVDMNPDTLALDLEDLERKVTSKTRAVIWVHLVGMIAADYRAILDFTERHDLFLIEDAAHAHGAEIDGRPAGSFGDASTFSFYPTKILTSGTGGMLTTDNPELAKFAREMRVFGKDEGTGEVVHYGNDWFLDEIRACVGTHHMSVLTEQLAHRRSLADGYGAGLANQLGIRLLDVPVGCAPSWYQYPVFLAEGIDRAALMAALKEKHGIEAKGIYKPTHEEQLFRGLDDGTLKNTEDVLHRSLCVPMHAELAPADVDGICRALVSELRLQVR